MDWFERLTGFRELDYEETRRRLRVDGRRLTSLVNGQSFGIGELELVSLRALRERVRAAGGFPGQLKIRTAIGDVRRMHQAPEYAGALFQVASQFNLLEMVSPDVVPEQGVARYQDDRTQGPACAIAAGAATIYRNYFAPVGDELGQTSARQLDGLGEVGAALSAALGRPTQELWSMRNGYAMCSRAGLDWISELLATSTPDELDAMRCKVRIGVHRDVEVTDSDERPGPQVSQSFCSALPVAYSGVPKAQWKPFATLVLEAAYEATLLAAVENAQRGGSKVVLLTRLGGGAFGNDDDWIDAAISRALASMTDVDIDVVRVRFFS